MEDIIRAIVAFGDEMDPPTSGIDLMRAFRDGELEGTEAGFFIAIELGSAGLEAKDVLLAMQAQGDLFNE